jgi:hypothetical protein
MAVNGKSEVRVTRDGDETESVTIITAHDEFQAQRVDTELTVCPVEHSLWREGHLWGHQDSDPCH